MTNMKKNQIGVVMLAILVLIVAACGKNQESGNPAVPEEIGKLNVVTTFYPIYYMAQEIGGDHVSVTNLIPTGIEPHDWTPKSRDMTTAANAQLFLYNGAGLEGWVDGFLKGLDRDNKVITVEVSAGIELIRGEYVHDHDHGHDHDHEAVEEDTHDHDHEAEGDHDHATEEEHDHGHADEPAAADANADDKLQIDPHTWTSPRSGLKMAVSIKDAFIQADPDHAADYEAGYARLSERLTELDQAYTTSLAPYAGRDIVVSHQAFGYLCRDYNLHQIAIMGLSPDAEPRAQDLLEITKYVKEHGIKVIFFEELVSDRIAKTLASEAKVDTLVLNPIEGLTNEQEKAGENYFTLLERNLENLQKALQ